MKSLVVVWAGMQNLEKGLLDLRVSCLFMEYSYGTITVLSKMI